MVKVRGDGYLMLPGVEAQSVATNAELIVNFLSCFHLSHHWLHLTGGGEEEEGRRRGGEGEEEGRRGEEKGTRGEEEGRRRGGGERRGGDGEEKGRRGEEDEEVSAFTEVSGLRNVQCI